ncbi:ogr/Delta-like zinc finger family protein [Spartinivicinus ruber]|uniref:ogr/Delta-like zinc finger family protein n=1 Tax=Spartinivicinus ruber TaxID=2683272 RepID=UPI0013D59228|nr:ogr/Delta-like zinc finger family protein [Spartinivicinus ruber]
MQINCPHCEHKAVIKSRYNLSKDVSDLYCRCKNTECNHKFVMKLSFSHTLSTPEQVTTNPAVAEFLQGLSEKDRQLIAQQLMAS